MLRRAARPTVINSTALGMKCAILITILIAVTACSKAPSSQRDSITSPAPSPTGAVGSDWEVDWSYDCSAGATPGRFIVTVFEPDGDFVVKLVDVAGIKDEGVARDRQQDSFYVGITSDCSWHVTVRG